MGKRLLAGLGVSAAALWLGSTALCWCGVGASTADDDPRFETTIVPTLSGGLSITTRKQQLARLNAGL